MREFSKMYSIKVLVIGDNAFARSVVEKLNADDNEQNLEIISISREEDFSLGSENITVNEYELGKILDIALARRVSLSIVCDVELIAKGIVDLFNTEGLSILAPNLEAAEICLSRNKFKEFTHRHMIPSSSYVSFENKDLCIAYLEHLTFPITIKADHIFETNYEKKEFIAKEINDAIAFIEDYFSQPFLSTFKKRLILEEYIVSEEFCTSLIYDSKTALSLIPIKLHREYNEYSNVFHEKSASSILDSGLDEIIFNINTLIIKPFLNALIEDGINFSGFFSFITKFSKEGDLVLDRCEILAPELCAELGLDLIEENLFDLFFSSVQAKLDFYRDGLRYVNLAGVALDLDYQHPNPESLNEDKFLQIERTASNSNYRIKVQILSNETRDSVRLFIYAPSETEAKNFARTVASELNLLSEENDIFNYI